MVFDDSVILIIDCGLGLYALHSTPYFFSHSCPYVSFLFFFSLSLSLSLSFSHTHTFFVSPSPSLSLSLSRSLSIYINQSPHYQGTFLSRMANILGCGGSKPSVTLTVAGKRLLELVSKAIPQVNEWITLLLYRIFLLFSTHYNSSS